MLYLEHFGLRQPPFGITPDTGFFFGCRSTQDALNTLLVALSGGSAFVKITGEVGTGKTLLCRLLMRALDRAKWTTLYLSNPSLEPRSLLLEVAQALSAPIEQGADLHHILRSTGRKLLMRAREGKGVVLCVDEGQVMSLETLETLRLLTNLETEKRKLLQVVLFAQPEFDAKLARQIGTPGAGGQYQVVAGYVTRGSAQAAHSPALLLNPPHLGEGMDASAESLRRRGEGFGGENRVGVAVAGRVGAERDAWCETGR